MSSLIEIIKNQKGRKTLVEQYFPWADGEREEAQNSVYNGRRTIKSVLSGAAVALALTLGYAGNVAAQDSGLPDGGLPDASITQNDGGIPDGRLPQDADVPTPTENSTTPDTPQVPPSPDTTEDSGQSQSPEVPEVEDPEQTPEDAPLLSERDQIIQEARTDLRSGLSNLTETLIGDGYRSENEDLNNEEGISRHNVITYANTIANRMEVAGLYSNLNHSQRMSLVLTRGLGLQRTTDNFGNEYRGDFASSLDYNPDLIRADVLRTILSFNTIDARLEASADADSDIARLRNRAEWRQDRIDTNRPDPSTVLDDIREVMDDLDLYNRLKLTPETPESSTPTSPTPATPTPAPTSEPTQLETQRAEFTSDLNNYVQTLTGDNTRIGLLDFVQDMAGHLQRTNPRYEKLSDREVESRILGRGLGYRWTQDTFALEHQIESIDTLEPNAEHISGQVLRDMRTVVSRYQRWMNIAEQENAPGWAENFRDRWNTNPDFDLTQAANVLDEMIRNDYIIGELEEGHQPFAQTRPELEDGVSDIASALYNASNFITRMITDLASDERFSAQNPAHRSFDMVVTNAEVLYWGTVVATHATEDVENYDGGRLSNAQREARDNFLFGFGIRSEDLINRDGVDVRGHGFDYRSDARPSSMIGGDNPTNDAILAVRSFYADETNSDSLALITQTNDAIDTFYTIANPGSTNAEPQPGSETVNPQAPIEPEAPAQPEQPQQPQDPDRTQPAVPVRTEENDGGIVDGGIVDGGIVDGGISDAGVPPNSDATPDADTNNSDLEAAVQQVSGGDVTSFFDRSTSYGFNFGDLIDQYRFDYDTTTAELYAQGLGEVSAEYQLATGNSLIGQRRNMQRLQYCQNVLDVQAEAADLENVDRAFILDMADMYDRSESTIRRWLKQDSAALESEYESLSNQLFESAEFDIA